MFGDRLADTADAGADLFDVVDAMKQRSNAGISSHALGAQLFRREAARQATGVSDLNSRSDYNDDHCFISASQVLPFSVTRYFCRLLVGLSGIVRSIHPDVMSGSR